MLWRVRLCVLMLAPWVLSGQAVVLHVRVAEGEGAVQAAGSRVSSPLAVIVTDETGKPVEGAAVTFRLPEEGPSGTFANGLRSDVARTSAGGRARAGAVRWNKVTGPLQIRVTAVKDHARAGLVVAQYLAVGGPGAGAPVLRVPRWRGRWLALTALAGGAAAAGFAVGKTRSPGRAPAPTEPPLRIGPPVITVGRP